MTEPESRVSLSELYENLKFGIKNLAFKIVSYEEKNPCPNPSSSTCGIAGSETVISPGASSQGQSPRVKPVFLIPGLLPCQPCHEFFQNMLCNNFLPLVLTTVWASMRHRRLHATSFTPHGNCRKCVRQTLPLKRTGVTARGVTCLCHVACARIFYPLKIPLLPSYFLKLVISPTYGLAFSPQLPV